MANIDVKAERELGSAAAEGVREIAAEQLDLISGGNPTSVGAAAGSACGHAGQEMLFAASSAGNKIGGSSGPPPLAPNPYQ
jgi:hypothetical protein